MCKTLFLSLFITLTACTPTTSSVESYGRHPDAKVWLDAPPPDDPLPTVAGWDACYNQGDPNYEVNLSVNYCCFDEIDVPHWGWPEPLSGATGNCLRSWSFCDGNDDCGGATPLCTSHLQTSTVYPPALIYSIQCRAALGVSDNGTIPDKQLCHPGDGTCPIGTSCVLASSVPNFWNMQPNSYVCN